MKSRDIWLTVLLLLNFSAIQFCLASQFSLTIPSYGRIIEQKMVTYFHCDFEIPWEVGEIPPCELRKWWFINDDPPEITISQVDEHHSGSYSAKFLLDRGPDTSDQHCKLFERQTDPEYPEPYPTVQEAYYSAWYYFPSTFKLGQWRNIMQWGEPPERIGYPTISLRIDRNYGDPAPLCVRIKNSWTDTGKNEIRKTTYNENTIPKDQWISIQVYVKIASDYKVPDGHIKVWLNGELILDWSDAPTRNSNTYWYQWGIGNYGDDQESAGQYILIDDVMVTSEYRRG